MEDAGEEACTTARRTSLVRADDEPSAQRETESTRAAPRIGAIPVVAVLSEAPDWSRTGRSSIAAGAEMGLVLDFPSGERRAVEAKWSRVPRTTKGFHLAPEALAPDRCFLVSTGPDRYPVTDTVEAISLRELAAELLARRSP